MLCDYCGEKRELIKEGKARICEICKNNQGKTRGHEIKHEEYATGKSVSLGKINEFYLRKKEGIVLGNFD